MIRTSLMSSAKSVGPRIDPWGTPALTGYSCDHFPCRTRRSYLLLRKEEIRRNIWPKIWHNLNFWSRPACQTLPKSLDISSATGHLTSDLLKILAILSDATVRTFSSDQENLKSYLKSEKAHMRNNPIFTSFSKTLLTTERRLTGRQFLVAYLSPTSLNTATTNETLKQSRK